MPRVRKQISATITSEAAEAIRNAATAEGLTLSECLDRVIKAYFKLAPPAPPKPSR